jgi:hypothetical protein
MLWICVIAQIRSEQKLNTGDLRVRANRFSRSPNSAGDLTLPDMNTSGTGGVRLLPLSAVPSGGGAMSLADSLTPAQKRAITLIVQEACPPRCDPPDLGFQMDLAVILRLHLWEGRLRNVSPEATREYAISRGMDPKAFAVWEDPAKRAELPSSSAAATLLAALERYGR